jgi:hypothetical protein
MKCSFVPLKLAVLSFCATLPPLYGQTSSPPKKLPPDLANISYGPHERNVLDLWKAKSPRPTPLVIYIHGGGFRQGDKNSVSAALLAPCLEAGISVAAINYRLSHQASFPAPMLDGARAVQYLRSRANEWNLDPRAFAASGRSAGAGISLWVGFHDDMANPKSADPVERHSTRLSAMGIVNGQSSYDLRFLAKLIGEPAAQHPALPPFYGLRGEELKTERAYRLFEEAAPLTYLSAGDPPVFMYYTYEDVPLRADSTPNDGIHHPRLGYYLKEQMDKLGIESTVRLKEAYADPADRRMYQDMIAFFRKHFPR